jgi:hypothetical protein
VASEGKVQKRPQERDFKRYPSLRISELAHIAENIDAFCEGSNWVRGYLARPHHELGRIGNVCPFAQPALDSDAIRIAVVRLVTNNKRAEILDAIEYHLESFVSHASASTDATLHATLILFPDVLPSEAPYLIDHTKEELKPRFVEQGLMLGEFHADNNSRGLHNPDFRPLRSSIPILAIRRIVSTDFVFLNRPEYDAATRLQYLQAYLSVPGISKNNREEVEKAVASLRTELQCHASQY